jgi:D-alanyl-D-alanine carboxypeptidase
MNTASNKIFYSFLLLLLLLPVFSYSFQGEEYDLSDFRNTIQQQLDTLYDANTDFGGVTIGVVLPDGQKCGFAIGYADEENKIKMKPQDRMLGGSTGKIFVSASMMQLVASGKVQLDDKVQTYLGHHEWYSRVQNYDLISIRNLMQHASGISRYVFAEQFQLDIHEDADRVWKPAELLAYVFDKDPLFVAGSDFAYADTNYILLAMILESVAKETMYDYVDKHILQPFQLSGISPQTERKIKGLVVGYNSPDDVFFPGTVVEDGQYKYNLQFEWAGGGFVMDVVDLAEAGKMIYEGQVFESSLLGEFYTGIDAKQLGGKWGLGVHMKETPMGMSYGHSGFFPGYVTNMLYFPDQGFSIAIQVNTSDRSKMGLYRKMFDVIPEVSKYIKSSN